MYKTLFKGKSLFDDAVDMIDYLIKDYEVVSRSDRHIHSRVGDPGIVEFELPGVKKSDIKLKTQKSGPFILINVSAKRGDKTFNGSHAVRAEDIDANNITSRYENGLLSVKIPKQKKNDSEERLIQIEGPS